MVSLKIATLVCCCLLFVLHAVDVALEILAVFYLLIESFLYLLKAVLIMRAPTMT